MALSQDIVQQFAKTVTPKEEPKEATYNATYKSIGGKDYVQIDGSEILTPVKTTVVAEEDDRVKVMIKEHTATIIGNITSPSARSTDLNNLKDTVDEQGNTIQQMDNTIIQQGNSIIQLNNTVNQQGNTINQHNTILNQHGDQITSMNNTLLLHENAIELANDDIIIQGGRIDSLNDTINSQGNAITAMNNTIQQHGNNITQINNTIQQQGNEIVQQGNRIDQQGNTIQQMGDTILSHGNLLILYGNEISMLNSSVDINESAIRILNSGFEIVDGVLKGLSQIVIEDLETNTLNADYAQIDFANINIEAVEKLFAESGIINNLIVEEGHISGELVGVTLKGDLIEGNTIVADKLVIKGSDGLYYKLNTNGETIESEQTNQNSLNGQVIAAKSITASKISVNDLVAFGATIGGFIIGEHSIHSTLKSGPDSPAQGLYLGDDGQFAFGDTANYVKYVKDENNNFILSARLSDLYLGSGTQKADEYIQTQLHLTADGITTEYSSSGGSNLLRNSVGYNDTYAWVKTGNVTTRSQEDISFSGSEFILTGNSSLEQLYSTVPNEEYSVAFKYKHTKVGTAGQVSVIIDGQNGSRVEALKTTEVHNEWTTVTLSTPYKATTSTPKIIIACSDSDDVFEITDLIISKGTNNVWSQYKDEVYSRNHSLDKEGLRFYNDGKTKGSTVDTSNISFEENGTVVAGLNKDRLLTSTGQFQRGYEVGRLKTLLLDENNIIEYIG